MKSFIISLLLVFTVNGAFAATIYDPTWMIVTSVEKQEVPANKKSIDFVAILHGHMEDQKLYRTDLQEEGPIGFVVCSNAPNEKGEWGAVIDNSIKFHEAEMVIPSRDLCDDLKAKVDAGTPFKLQVDRKTQTSGTLLAIANNEVGEPAIRLPMLPECSDPMDVNACNEEVDSGASHLVTE